MLPPPLFFSTITCTTASVFSLFPDKCNKNNTSNKNPEFETNQTDGEERALEREDGKLCPRECEGKAKEGKKVREGQNSPASFTFSPPTQLTRRDPKKRQGKRQSEREKRSFFAEQRTREREGENKTRES